MEVNQHCPDYFDYDAEKNDPSQQAAGIGEFICCLKNHEERIDNEHCRYGKRLQKM